MRASGVICEFNPIHSGHAYLLSRMREALGADGCIICLMSGRFVERGTAAVADPYLRADMALAAGADLVLELPFPWSAASAEHFARAGVRMLTRLGVETIAFGSECADQALLTRAAAAVAAPDFGETYAALTRTGMGTTAAYIEAVRQIMDGKNHLSQKDNLASDNAPSAPPPAGFPASNDLLAIAYLRALSDLAHAGVAPPRALVLRREGAAYTDTTLPTDAHPSATALRRLIREAADDPVALGAILDGTMPDRAREALLEAIARGDAPVDGARLLAYYHAHYRLADPVALATQAECGGGLAAHMVRCAQKSAVAKDFFSSLRTRLYPDARLRRALLFGVLGVTEADLRADPAYTTLLAATPRGCAYLAHLRRAAKAAAEATCPCPAGTDAHPCPDADAAVQPSSTLRGVTCPCPAGTDETTAAPPQDPRKSPASPQNHRERDRDSTVQNRGFTVVDFSKKSLIISNQCLNLPIVTKPADAPAGRQSQLALRADALFTLCYPAPRAAGELLRKTPVIRR